MEIKIMKDGPYKVSGKIPLNEKEIIQEEYSVHFRDTKNYEVNDPYFLCRCGKSKNKPFCDGSHIKCKFHGKETALRKPFIKQCVFYEGANIILGDNESLCAFARFCHSKLADVWTATDESENEEMMNAAIKMANDCPSGRLIILDKNSGKTIENYLEPAITIIKDSDRNCDGPLYVQGNIPIIGEDGYQYEVRNRVTLCRCGESFNKPFCDATHVQLGMKDEK